jgi:hypothetical protein
MTFGRQDQQVIANIRTCVSFVHGQFRSARTHCVAVTRRGHVLGLNSLASCGIGKNTFLVKIQVLVVTGLKMTVFWDVAPCSLVEIDLRFRGPDDNLSKYH